MRNVVGRSDLVFSIVSLGTVVLIPWLLVPAPYFWKGVGILGLFAGCFHSFMLWTVRRRQEVYREQVVGQIREVLRDEIKNKLAVLDFILAEVAEETDRRIAQDAHQVVEDIADKLDYLTEGSLEEWEEKYAASERGEG